MARPGEFDLIARYFAPLATEAGAFGLLDDAAVLSPEQDQEIVVTTDAVVAGVHFLADDSAASVARKALRVNLSDLAAMGAAPLGYTVALALNDAVDEAWIAEFATALGEDQARYAINLLGGDTVRTPGPMMVSITAMGTVEAGRALRRRGARIGDRLYVSGTIGDSALGLASLTGKIVIDDLDARAFLEDRYHHPRPRTGLGPQLVGLASACLDVSDGLIGDLDHICRQSGCGARIQAAQVPASAAAIGLPGDTLGLRLTGGDDYELLFAVPRDNVGAVERIGTEGDVPVTCIGEFVAGDGAVVIGPDGEAISLATRSWRHF